MAKRLISTVIGIAVLILVMALRNVVVFNIALTTVAIIGIHEFYSAFKNKEIKPDEPLIKTTTNKAKRFEELKKINEGK